MTLLHWIGDNLIVYVHQMIGADRPVILLPFGILSLFPLHAAHFTMAATTGGPARTHVIFHPGEVNYAYSARTLNRAERSAAAKAETALVVNNPVPLPATYDPLLLADAERDTVAAHFPIRELAGRAAVPEAVLAAVKGADIVHFICHGQGDSSRRYVGALLLAGQQILTAVQFAQTGDLTARLVVLSACRSGAAAVGPAAITSLPAMLVGAGANAVLATFWHTDEMATLLLVTRFYALWDGGRAQPARIALGKAVEWLMFATAAELRSACPAAALDNPAGQELAQAPPGECLYNDPYYWSAFFLVGNA